MCVKISSGEPKSACRLAFVTQCMCVLLDMHAQVIPVLKVRFSQNRALHLSSLLTLIHMNKNYLLEQKNNDKFKHYLWI